jgi:hypothetical protein
MVTYPRIVRLVGVGYLQSDARAFKGFRFPPEVIVLAVRWYPRFGLSSRDVEASIHRGLPSSAEELVGEAPVATTRILTGSGDTPLLHRVSSGALMLGGLIGRTSSW